MHTMLSADSDEVSRGMTASQVDRANVVVDMRADQEAHRLCRDRLQLADRTRGGDTSITVLLLRTAS